jgi:hypothetical protein
MARPHIDYLQSQTVPWQPSHWPHLPGCELKILSRDTDRGSASVLVRYPSGWAAPGPGFLGTGEEFLVLDGLLELDGRRCAQDTFGWFGAGYRHASRSAPDGAVVLAFYDAEPVWTHGEPPADRPAAEARVIDTFELPWAGGDGDAAFGGQGHLRKVLRDSPDAGAATMLIAAPPHLHPPRWRARQQIHGYAEELFLLSGDVLSNVGQLFPGAYLCRPAGVAHGPYGSRGGGLALRRRHGASVASTFTAHELTLARAPHYQPTLPPGLPAPGPHPWRPRRY